MSISRIIEIRKNIGIAIQELNDNALDQRNYRKKLILILINQREIVNIISDMEGRLNSISD